MNPYQDVIDWLRSDQGSAWSETRMMQAAVYAARHLGGAMAWHLNRSSQLGTTYPLYLAGVLSVKEDLPLNLEREAVNPDG